MTDQIFVRRVLIVLGIGIMTVILFRTMSLLLLIFAALVFATILGAARALITRLTRLEGPLALAAAVFLVLGVLVGVFAFFGRQVANEFATIQERLPAALASVEAQLDEWGMGESARQLFDQGAGDVGAQCGRKRVHRFGTVHRDDSDGVLPLDQHQHCLLLNCSTSPLRDRRRATTDAIDDRP